MRTAVRLPGAVSTLAPRVFATATRHRHGNGEYVEVDVNAVEAVHLAAMLVDLYKAGPPSDVLSRAVRLASGRLIGTAEALERASGH